MGEKEISGGYDAEFHPPLTEDFTCGICLLAFRDPMQLDCGHQYCKSCLEKYRGTHGVQFSCPLDREEVDMNKVFADKSMHRKVLSLTVKCNNHKISCDWIGELRSLEKHIEICPFVSVKCTNEGCLLYFLKLHLDDHLSHECEFRRMACEFCMATYAFKDGQDHVTSCKFWPLKCTKRCGKINIPRQEMDAHLNICPLSILPCSYVALGCTFMGAMDQRAEHENDNMQSHLKFAVEKISVLENKVETLEKGTLDMMHSLEEKIKKLDTRLVLQEGTPIDEAYKEVKKLKYGVFLWAIDDYQNKLAEPMLYGETFLSSQKGYTLRLLVCLNGWGCGAGTHITLMIQVMRGPNDDVLMWPFPHKISLSILHHTDETKHKTMICDPKDATEPRDAFNKPNSAYNSAKRYEEFLSHENIINDGFLCNNTIHVMCKILE